MSIPNFKKYKLFYKGYVSPVSLPNRGRWAASCNRLRLPIGDAGWLAITSRRLPIGDAGGLTGTIISFLPGYTYRELSTQFVNNSGCGRKSDLHKWLQR